MLAIAGWMFHDGGMAKSFLPVDRDQRFLLPPDVREWLPENHIVWFLVAFVERLDLSGFRARYRLGGEGRRPYDPAMLLTLLLYAYSQGVRSSRKIEAACRADVAYKVICGTYGDTPDHSTICRFRRLFDDEIDAVFVQVLAACDRLGMLPLGVIAVDGTKLAADASLSANRRVAAIEAEVARIRAEHEENDAVEEERYGERCGDEVLDELVDPASRRAALEAALEAVESETAPEAGRVNVTDPESRVLRDARGGFVQGYNAQVVAGEGGLILAAGATQAANDSGLLGAMLAVVEANLEAAGVERRPGTVLADAGYLDADDLDALLDIDDPEVVVATGKRTRLSPDTLPDTLADAIAEDDAIEAAKAAEVTRRVEVFERIKAGEINQTEAASELDLDRSRVSVIYRAWLTGGRDAIPVQTPPRTHPKPSQAQRVRAALNAKFADPDTAQLYKRRSHIAETPFARIKHARGGTRLSRRGLRAANAELRFEAVVNNTLRLHAAVTTLLALGMTALGSSSR